MERVHTFRMIVLAAAIAMGAQQAKAEGTTPIQLSLFPGLCLFDEDTAVRGMRVNFLLGVNESLSGIDLGCGVNWVRGPMTGLQIGGLGNKSDVLHGVQLGLIANSADTMRGLQIGIVNVAEDAQGIQIGMMSQVKGDLTGIQFSATPLIYAGGASSVEGTMKGWQSGLVCTAREMIGLQDGLIGNGAGRCRGAQLGLLNVAGSMTGIQLGLLNYSREMRGVQIGAVNIITESPLKFIPLVNAHF